MKTPTRVTHAGAKTPLAGLPQADGQDLVLVHPD